MKTFFAARRTAASLVIALAALGAGAPGATALPHTTGGPAAHQTRSPSRDARPVPFTEATVEQRPDGAYTVSWRAPGAGAVTVYADGRPVAHGAAEQTVTVRDLPAADRQWFRLVPDEGAPLTLADRSLHLEGAPNFRDVGGYRTAGGRWVRMGVLYRSDDLSRLTGADRAKLHRLGLRTDYDLRNSEERGKAPDRVPDGVRYAVADVAGDDIPSPTSPEDSVRLMLEGGRGVVALPRARAAYAEVFRAAADPGNHGMLFHCTAGKDRTGWAAAALLTALGVDRATVTRDYLATNTYRAAEVQAAYDRATPEVAAILKPVLEARTEYLDASFTEITERYGSFDAYLRTGLGLDDGTLDALRAELLTG